MTKVEVTCCLDDQSCVKSRSHVDCRYDVVTAMIKWQDHHAIYSCGWSAHCLQQSIRSWPIQTTTQRSIWMRGLWTCRVLPWLQCILRLSQGQAIYILRTLYGVSVGSIGLVTLQFKQGLSAFWLLTYSSNRYWVCSIKTLPIPSSF